MTLFLTLAGMLAQYHVARWAVSACSVVLYVLVLLTWSYLVWRRLKMAYDKDEALIYEGVVFRRKRRIDLAHLQGLMVRTGPIFKLLKRCEVTGETAGGLRRPEIRMPGWHRGDATTFKNTVYALTPDPEGEGGSDVWKTGFSLPLSYIFVSGLTSNSVMLAAVTVIVPLSTAIIKSLSVIDFNITHIITQGIFVWVISLMCGIFLEWTRTWASLASVTRQTSCCENVCDEVYRWYYSANNA